MSAAEFVLDGARAFQAMVAMRDRVRLNTFVFLPRDGGPRWPVILQRTPYGIAAADARDKTDCTRAWVADRASYVADDWLHAASWPPRGIAPHRLYLRGDGRLAERPGGGPRHYQYDPRRPIPSLGGRNMLIEAGPCDQRPARALPDYGLVYSGAPLPRDLTIAGPVRVHLSVASDCPDTDFVAKLVERRPDGAAMLLMDGVMRAMYRDSPRAAQPLAPGRTAALTITLGDICHTLRAGSRIEIDITSSNFPRRARNTNSGHTVLANDTEADIRVATNTIHHAGETPSFVELPVLPG